ncbi:hypothetical protein [Plesiomonas sp.]|uniref:hypothetical protein n=1 Tax=Plesiomonas sp. TaxID=2486279 RepID=UPI003F2F2CBD
MRRKLLKVKNTKQEERRKKKEERRKKKEENIRDIDSSNTTIEYTEHWHKKTPISYRRRKNRGSLYNANKLKEVKTTWSTASIA